MSDNVSSETKWPSWKIALAIGIPVTIIGVGAYYIFTNAKTKSEGKVKKPKSKQATIDQTDGIKNTTKSPAASSPKPVKPKTKIEEAQEKKNKGNKLFKQGLYDDAIKKYTEAISVCPEENKLEKATYYQNKAAAFEKQEKWADVVVECTAAINLNPKYVKALQRRAKAYDKVGSKESSLEDITTVCILEGFQNPSNMMYADTILKELGRQKAAATFKDRAPAIPSDLFLKQYFSSFVDDETLAPLTEEMKLAEATSGYIRAKILLENREYSNVIKECTEEIESMKQRGDDPTNESEKERRSYLTEALLLRGTFHMLSNSNDLARKDFDQIIQNTDVGVKFRANALIKRGSMSMQEQNPEKAVQDFNMAAEVDPDNCDVYHHRGQLNILLDKSEEALNDFRKCIELKPDLAMAYAQQCYTKYRQGVNTKNNAAIQEAMDEFERIIEKYPDCSETYGLYAQAQTDKDNYEKADQLFQQAAKVEPLNATFFVHRGLLALQWKQDVELAVKLITEALERDEKCDFAHETMGTIEVQRGNLEKAIMHFEKSIELAKTELELAHLYALKAAAVAQANIAAKYGLRPSVPPSFS